MLTPFKKRYLRRLVAQAFDVPVSDIEVLYFQLTTSNSLDFKALASSYLFLEQIQFSATNVVFPKTLNYNFNSPALISQQFSDNDLHQIDLLVFSIETLENKPCTFSGYLFRSKSYVHENPVT
jgi:hypothetical protein